MVEKKNDDQPSSVVNSSRDKSKPMEAMNLSAYFKESVMAMISQAPKQTMSSLHLARTWAMINPNLWKPGIDQLT